MKSTKIVIAIVAILTVLGGTFAGLWFFTDIFNFLKPENEVFSNQIEKALNIEEAKFVDYSDFLNEYKDMSSKPVSSKMNITADLNISDLDSDVQDIINKSKITVESNSDLSNKKAQAKIGLFTDNKEVLSLETITDGDKMAIGSEDLYDKYLTFSMEDIVELAAEESDMDEEEVEQLLNTLSNSNVDPYELLYISEDDLKHFDETYRDVLKTLINKDCYSSEKGVEVEVNGEDVKTTAYYLTLTGEDMYNFINDFANLIKDDDVIAKIVAEKVNMLLEATGEEKISEKDVKELLSDLTESLTDELEDLKEEKSAAIQIAVYSKSNNPVRIEFNMIDDVENMDEKETLFIIEYSKEKTVYSVVANEAITISLVHSYDKNSDEEKVGKFELKMAGMKLGTLDYELINKKDESKIDLALNVPLSEIEPSSDDLTADIEFNSKGDYTKEEVTYTGLFNFKYGSESVKVNFDGSTKYGEADIPTLNDKNSVDVLNLSEKEMQEVLNDILENAADVLPERLDLIGVDIDKEDILPNTVTPNTNTLPTTTPENTNTNTTPNTNSNAGNLNTNIPTMDKDKVNEMIDKNQDQIVNSMQDAMNSNSNAPQMNADEINQMIDKSQELMNSMQ